MTEVLEVLWELDFEWFAAVLAGIAAAAVALCARVRPRRLVLLVTLDELDAVGEVAALIRRMGLCVLDVDLDADIGGVPPGEPRLPSAVFTLRTDGNDETYFALISAAAQLPCVYSVRTLVKK